MHTTLVFEYLCSYCCVTNHNSNQNTCCTDMGQRSILNNTAVTTYLHNSVIVFTESFLLQKDRFYLFEYHVALVCDIKTFLITGHIKNHVINNQ